MFLQGIFSWNWLVVFASLAAMGNSFSVEYLSKIGTRGGKKTLKRKGKQFFSEISRMRKKFRGGRPKKEK